MKDFAKIFHDDEGRQILVYVDCGDPAEIHIIFQADWALCTIKLGYSDADAAERGYSIITRDLVIQKVNPIREEIEMEH